MSKQDIFFKRGPFLLFVVVKVKVLALTLITNSTVDRKPCLIIIVLRNSVTRAFFEIVEFFSENVRKS